MPCFVVQLFLYKPNQNEFWKSESIYTDSLITQGLLLPKISKFLLLYLTLQNNFEKPLTIVPFPSPHRNHHPQKPSKDYERAGSFKEWR